MRTLLVTCAVVGLVTAAANAGDTLPSRGPADPGAATAHPLDATAADAAAAALRAALKDKDYANRIAVVRKEGLGVHEKVADALLDVLRRDADLGVRKECLTALAYQKPAAARVVSAVCKWVDEIAGSESARLKKNDPGFPVDPKTGDPQLETDDGKIALNLMAARAGAVEEALRCVRALTDEAPPSAAQWGVFLQDPLDALVIELLNALAAWKTWAVLPEMHRLFVMYPEPGRWETGKIVDLGGTNASARRSWIVVYGHPAKQTARPEVVKALQAAFLAMSGREFDEPPDVLTWMQRPDVAARIAGKKPSKHGG